MNFRSGLCAFGLAMAIFVADAAGHPVQCPKGPLKDMEETWALAVTWQAGFCETRDPSRPQPVECEEASKMTEFSLHGLWPQWKEFCVEALPPQVVQQNPKLAAEPCSFGSPKARDQLPEVKLSPALDAKLRRVMPGVQSKLERHEYFKHGTCSMMSQEDYFAKAIDLVKALNASGLRSFINENHGKVVSPGQLCGAIEASLGKEAVAAVEADGTPFSGADGVRRRYLTELRIWLKPVNGTLALAAGNYVPVPLGVETLGPEPSNPLCNDAFYIDKPGMRQ